MTAEPFACLQQRPYCHRLLGVEIQTGPTDCRSRQFIQQALFGQALGQQLSQHRRFDPLVGKLAVGDSFARLHQRQRLGLSG